MNSISEFRSKEKSGVWLLTLERGCVRVRHSMRFVLGQQSVGAKEWG